MSKDQAPYFARLESALNAAAKVVLAVGYWMLALIVPLTVAGVILGAMRTPLSIPLDWMPLLLREGLAINGLFELQWHFFTVAAMLAMGPLWLRNSHIRADFLRQKLSPRTVCLIDIGGHLLFGLPFVLLLLMPSFDFAMSAYRSGEGSLDAGLTDRFLVKFSIAFGFFLMAVAGIFLLIRDLRKLALYKEDRTYG